MTGEAEFAEMFFDDMRIPHENLIGELGMGWYAAMGRSGGAILTIMESCDTKRR